MYTIIICVIIGVIVSITVSSKSSIEERGLLTTGLFGIIPGFLLGLFIGLFVPTDYDTEEYEYCIVSEQFDSHIFNISGEYLSFSYFDSDGSVAELQIKNPSCVSVVYSLDVVKPVVFVTKYSVRNKFSTNMRSSSIKILIPV